MKTMEELSQEIEYLTEDHMIDLSKWRNIIVARPNGTFECLTTQDIKVAQHNSPITEVVEAVTKRVFRFRG